MKYQLKHIAIFIVFVSLVVSMLATHNRLLIELVGAVIKVSYLMAFAFAVSHYLENRLTPMTYGLVGAALTMFPETFGMFEHVCSDLTTLLVPSPDLDNLSGNELSYASAIHYQERTAVSKGVRPLVTLAVAFSSAIVARMIGKNAKSVSEKD